MVKGGIILPRRRRTTPKKSRYGQMARNKNITGAEVDHVRSPRRRCSLTRGLPRVQPLQATVAYGNDKAGPADWWISTTCGWGAMMTGDANFLVSWPSCPVCPG